MHRNRNFILAVLAITALATSCGLSEPVALDGTGGGRLSRVEAEQAYLDAVHDDSSDIGEYLDDPYILEFGQNICEQLDDGDTADEIMGDVEQMTEETDEDVSDEAKASVLIMTRLALVKLCPS